MVASRVSCIGLRSWRLALFSCALTWAVSITGEHGVGIEKRQFMPSMFSAESIDCMKRLRVACDPQEIANRGKMFPDAEAPALTFQGLHPLEKAGVASRM